MNNRLLRSAIIQGQALERGNHSKNKTVKRESTGNLSKRLTAMFLVFVMLITMVPSSFVNATSTKFTRMSNGLYMSTDGRVYTQEQVQRILKGDGADKLTEQQADSDSGDTSEEQNTQDSDAQASGGDGSIIENIDVEGDSDGGSDTGSDSTAAEQQYHVTPDSATPSYEKFKNMSEWSDRKIIKAPANTYALTVATGASAGDTVLYFVVRYKDIYGITKSQFVFPSVDGKDKSDALLAYYGGKGVASSYGSKVAEEINYKDEAAEVEPLDEWTVQDYAFQTETAIKSVEKVELYLQVGQWTTQGLSIYKVDRYKGYEDYGLISGQQFLDFEGYLIADVKKKANKVLTFSTSNDVDRVETIGGGDDNEFCEIINYTDKSNQKKFATTDSVYSMRVDFADKLNSGIESFLNSDASKLSDDNGIVEDMAFELQYRDIHGWTRKVMVPFILSSYLTAKKGVGDATIMGIGQRGDIVATNLLLPEYEQLITSPSLFMSSSARSKIEANGVSVANETAKMKANADKTLKDDISLSGVSIYKGGCMPYVRSGTDSEGKVLAGATLEYVFENTAPLMYYTTMDINGRMVKAGGTDKIKLVTYSGNNPLIATKQSKDMYLVTLNTSNKKQAGTKDDISLKFSYDKQTGGKGDTTTYMAKQAANEFLGSWPDTVGDNFVTKSGLVDGGQISFLIDVPELKSFTGVQMALLGEDEWDMSNLRIAYVESYDKRLAFNVPVGDGNATSNFWVERQMISSEIFSLAGIESVVLDDDGNEIDENGGIVEEEKVQAKDENGDPLFDDDGNPVYERDDENKEKTRKSRIMDTQLFTGGNTYNIAFNTKTIEDVRDVNYAEVRYKMSHEQTSINWGFFKKRKTYDIAVKVADDPEYDVGMGDSGSTNYFYFQLLFKNGNSAYVLANQQISSDGFRSGNTEIFSIATNQDYGDLRGVRIIPEDISKESDPFDKLNVEKVTVTEQSNGGACMIYEITDVGWIDIDYRDENEDISLRQRQARTAADLSKIYKVTNKKWAVNLLCEYNNLPWDNDFFQFKGSVMATVYYLNSASNSIEKAEFDVVSRLAAYMNKTALSYDAKTDPDAAVVPAAQMKTISDPEWMFRPNTRDRFVMPAIPDCASVKSMVFTAQSRNGYPATWNIGEVDISEIKSDGTLSLLDKGEYSEYYRNMKTVKLCSNVDKDTITTLNVPIGTPVSSRKIEFADNTIKRAEDGWATPVSRIPDSEDDTFNIFLFPSTNSLNLSNRNVNMFLQYGIPFSGYMQKSDVLRKANEGTSKAMWYATGLKVPGFISASTLGIQCTDENAIFDHAIVQHVREDVVISNYAYGFLGGSNATITFRSDPLAFNQFLTKTDDDTEETIALSFGKGTKTQQLTSESNDIAVAFHYKSSLDGAEYTSPYVYLTDQGYSSISEGTFAELNFDVPYVDEITGYTIAGYGNIKGNVYAGAGVVYTVEKEQNKDSGAYEVVGRKKKSYASFKDSYALTTKPTKYKTTSKLAYGEDSVAPVAITFKTAEASNNLESGTTSKVQMIFKYSNYQGAAKQREFADITPYIQGEKKEFVTNESATIKFFVKELNNSMSISAVDVCPYNGKKIDKENITTLSEEAMDSQETTGDTTAADKAATNTTDTTNTQTTNTTDQTVQSDPVQRNAPATDNNTNTGTTTGTGATTNTGAAGDKVTAGTSQADATTAISNLTDTDEVKKLNEILASRNATWTISEVILDIGFGEKRVSRVGDQTFYGIDLGGTVRLNDVHMRTTYTVAGKGPYQVGNEVSTVLCKPKDTLNATVNIEDSTAGYKLRVYRMVGEAGEDVTASTITRLMSTEFTFVAPENSTGETEIYKIEISPIEAPDIVDTIMVTVEFRKSTEEASTEKATESSDSNKSTEKPTEATTEKPTEATTEKPTEATTETTTESTTESSTEPTDSTGGQGETPPTP